MAQVKIRDVQVIMTQPPCGGRFTVVKVETNVRRADGTVVTP